MAIQNKVHFSELFDIGVDGMIQPRRVIKLGGVMMSPGIRFSRGTSFAGIDLFLFTDKYLHIEEQNGEINIIGVFD